MKSEDSSGDNIGIQQNIQICYRNLLRMKREKTEKQLALVTERNNLNKEINVVVNEIIDIDGEISKLQQSCTSPKHETEEVCPDCGFPL